MTHLFFTCAAVLLAAPVQASAQLNNPLSAGGQRIDSIGDFIKEMLEAAVFILFPIAVVFIVYSGFLFVFAQGNPEKLSTAKRNFMWTIVGMALLLGAWALAQLIDNTLDAVTG